jgi:hypothetical protein
VRTLLHELTDEAKRNHVSSLDVAVVYAAMGAKDQAFEWLEKAYAENRLVNPHQSRAETWAFAFRLAIR